MFKKYEIYLKNCILVKPMLNDYVLFKMKPNTDEKHRHYTIAHEIERKIKAKFRVKI